jgi:hypothetical protein
VAPGLSAFCPNCEALRAPGPECPRCGVIYAKARPRPAPPPAPPPGPDDVVGDARGLLPGQQEAVWTGDADDARREVLVRAIAPPVALLVTWLLVSSDSLRMLLRTVLSMWLHELGHAVAAWLSGHFALPGPWRTPVSAGRVPAVVILLAAGLCLLTAWGWRTRRTWAVAAGASGLFLQLVFTLLPRSTAGALFSFAGDAGGMILGTVLFATIWSHPEGRLAQTWLRWGFLVIGAAGLVDPLRTWIPAAVSNGEIPLGVIDGVGKSDASQLFEIHRWSLSDIAGRFATVGVGCLGALVIAYPVGLAWAKRRLRAAEAAVSGTTEPPLRARGGPAGPP